MDIYPCFILPSFEAEQAHHHLGLPPLDFVHCVNGSGPVLTQEKVE